MKKIILINGKARSGKDTVAELIRKKLETFEEYKNSVVIEHFASPLKEICESSFETTINNVNCVVDEIGAMLMDFGDNETVRKIRQKLHDDLWTIKGPGGSWYNKKNVLTRGLLQNVGTEIFRNRVDEKYWTNEMVRRLEASRHRVFIIPDFRFPNEFNDLEHLIRKGYEIITIKVERDSKNLENFDKTDNHSSEQTPLDKFDIEIKNNGTLEELEQTVNKVFDYLMGEYKIDNAVLNGIKKYNEIKCTPNESGEAREIYTQYGAKSFFSRFFR